MRSSHAAPYWMPLRIDAADFVTRLRSTSLPGCESNRLFCDVSLATVCEGLACRLAGGIGSFSWRSAPVNHRQNHGGIIAAQEEAHMPAVSEVLLLAWTGPLVGANKPARTDAANVRSLAHPTTLRLSYLLAYNLSPLARAKPYSQRELRHRIHPSASVR